MCGTKVTISRKGRVIEASPESIKEEIEIGEGPPRKRQSQEIGTNLRVLDTHRRLYNALDPSTCQVRAFTRVVLHIGLPFYGRFK